MFANMSYSVFPHIIQSFMVLPGHSSASYHGVEENQSVLGHV